MMFKTLVVCVFISTGCVITEAKQQVAIEPSKAAKLLEIILTCSSETRIDASTLVQIKMKNFEDNDVSKRFLVCAFKKAGVLNSNGNVIADKFMSYYPSNVDRKAIQKAIDECQQTDDDVKEQVFKWVKCYKDKTPVEIKLLN